MTRDEYLDAFLKVKADLEAARGALRLAWAAKHQADAVLEAAKRAVDDADYEVKVVFALPTPEDGAA